MPGFTSRPDGGDIYTAHSCFLSSSDSKDTLECNAPVTIETPRAVQPKDNNNQLKSTSTGQGESSLSW
ncbi:hypothetical protein AAFF_G00112000 [Aldrovandia affinis]|uniref:Uncharacterized protein n=1 Tax=Aldrovandia affinis TaxID=143900 RepID=A0AAD7RTD7_9TELE|nr:hypothetical protein AAFF_G00112000 [Aldrovandia affinis]